MKMEITLVAFILILAIAGIAIAFMELKPKNEYKTDNVHVQCVEVDEFNPTPATRWTVSSEIYENSGYPHKFQLGRDGVGALLQFLLHERHINLSELLQMRQFADTCLI